MTKTTIPIKINQAKPTRIKPPKPDCPASGTREKPHINIKEFLAKKKLEMETKTKLKLEAKQGEQDKPLRENTRASKFPPKQETTPHNSGGKNSTVTRTTYQKPNSDLRE